MNREEIGFFKAILDSYEEVSLISVLDGKTGGYRAYLPGGRARDGFFHHSRYGEKRRRIQGGLKMFDETKVLAALTAGGRALRGDVRGRAASTLIQVESERIEKLEKGVGFRRRPARHQSLADLFCLHQFARGGPPASSLAMSLRRATRPGRQGGRAASERKGPATRSSITAPPNDVDMRQRKIDLVRSVEAAARKMEKRIRQVKVMYRDARQRVRIAGSDGTQRR